MVSQYLIKMFVKCQSDSSQVWTRPEIACPGHQCQFRCQIGPESMLSRWLGLKSKPLSEYHTLPTNNICCTHMTLNLSFRPRRHHFSSHKESAAPVHKNDASIFLHKIKGRTTSGICSSSQSQNRSLELHSLALCSVLKIVFSVCSNTQTSQTCLQHMVQALLLPRPRQSSIAHGRLASLQLYVNLQMQTRQPFA